MEPRLTRQSRHERTTPQCEVKDAGATRRPLPSSWPGRKRLSGLCTACHGKAVNALSEARTGTYILLLHLPEPRHLIIGRLGGFDFPAGWYAYVGSAFGAGGLRGRIQHHLRSVERPHWHIDYLRAAAPCEHIWFQAGISSQEHEWALILGTMAGATIAAPRFGASDCRCPSHLFHFVTCPDLAEFCDRTGSDVTRWTAGNL
ncbi:MAG: GIY-YIG nuclease family protein [Anaerolineae bacterium]|nr:GIY-YIG nuclease family protein [Anaerolineae bacterium]